MEKMKKLLDPITQKDLGKDAWNVFDGAVQYNAWVNPYTSEEKLKFQEDLVNLLEGRVKPDSFDPKYRNKLINFYRYSATHYPSKAPFVAKRIRETLTIV